MARQMVVEGPNGRVHLQEVLADNEAELQDKLRHHPELVPVDELGLEGPLLVVGRETSLPSGAVDLVAMARNGAILVIEFKTGPQNSDFRHALAQMLDYGSHLWEMESQDFEATVARRYFASDDSPYHPGCEPTVAEAAKLAWPNMSDEELVSFEDAWTRVLRSGSFHYVLVAQRFTPTITRTMHYMNEASRSARFYAVELVRFSSGDIDAYEGRTVVRHDPSSTTSRAAAQTTEHAFLEKFDDSDYRSAVDQLLAFCRGQDLVLEWGSVGVSMRMRIPDVTEPISIGWLFPPGASGWLGLRDLTLGHDTWRARDDFPDPEVLDSWVDTVEQLPGAQPPATKGVRGYRIPPVTVVGHYDSITDVIAGFVEKVASQA